jgi:hypothetical protein
MYVCYAIFSSSRSRKRPYKILFCNEDFIIYRAEFKIESEMENEIENLLKIVLQ